MPLYEFHCKPCDLTFEELVRSASEKVHCPKCEGKVKRLLSTCVSHSAGGASSAKSSGSTGKSSGCGGCHGGSCSGCH
jgi:putative FmdB family regulatory protein